MASYGLKVKSECPECSETVITWLECIVFVQRRDHLAISLFMCATLTPLECFLNSLI